MWKVNNNSKTILMLCGAGIGIALGAWLIFAAVRPVASRSSPVPLPASPRSHSVPALTTLVTMPAPKATMPLQKKTTSPPFTLTATLDQNIPAGQPVVVTLALHNNGAQSLMIGGSAFEPSSFQFVVKDSQDHVVPRTANGNRVLTPPMAVSANATVEIGAGQTIPYRFNLARLFDLSKAGNYTVSVSRTIGINLWPFPVNPLKPGQPTPPHMAHLVINSLPFHIAEDASAASGPIPVTPLPGQQTYLYLASRYQPGISRYQVGSDGSLTFVFDPSAPRPPQISTAENGAAAITAAPDGRTLYASNTNGTVSQFHIGAGGVLSPLSPPTVPAPKYPSPFLMDPLGRYLFPGCPYTIGADGRLAVTTAAPNAGWPNDREHNIVPSGYCAINPTGTFLYACNGFTYVYRLAPDGQATALPPPTSGTAGQNSGRDNAIALSPSGKFAYVGVSTENGSAYFDLVVPMRVAADGSLTPIPGAARQPEAPPLPWPGYQQMTCTALAVDPTGHFLVVVSAGDLDAFRIEADGTLTPLGLTKTSGNINSIFFLPNQPFVYAINQNPPLLFAFRLDANQGLLPAGLDMPQDVPFAASTASAVAPTLLQWGQATGGLEISAFLPKNVQTADQPVVLTVLLRNVSSVPLSLGPQQQDMSSFHLSIIGPQQQSPHVLRGLGEPATAEVPLLAAGHDLFDAKVKSHRDGKAIILPPGGEQQYQLVLTRLADMTVSGFYTIQVTRSLPNGASASSNKLNLLLQGFFDGIQWNNGPGSGQGVSVM